jgi:beta-glucanase (GH16 family)
MRKGRLMLAVATVAVTLSGGLFAASRNDSADAAVGPVVWSDEFNGSGAIDGSKWNIETGNNNGWGNGESQYYTGRTENLRQEGGNLVITARKESYNGFGYTSARITTSNKFSQTYGRMEARIKIPRGQGIWPAFWMLGQNISQGTPWPNSGEIDIMENVGKEPNTVYGTVHGPGYSGGGGITGSRNIGRALADDFHTYGIEWSPNLIRWFLDGSEYHRVTPSNVTGTWVFDKPQFLLLNVAVGGAWPGYPDGSTQFPQTMLVDWVRVNSWTNDGGGTPPPSGSGNNLRSSFSNRCIDIPAANPADGARLQMYDCNGTAAQQWTFNGDGTVRAMGKCMDPAGAGTANRTPIQLVTCNGNPVQRFNYVYGELRNPSSGRCVDIDAWNANNGAQLILWDCTGGANQKWTRN